MTDKIEPCSYCTAKCELQYDEIYGFIFVRCNDRSCGATGPNKHSDDDAIAAHNVMARAVRENAVLRAEVAAARVMLVKYGRHINAWDPSTRCQCTYRDQTQCTCGFDAALDAARKAMGK